MDEDASELAGGGAHDSGAAAARGLEEARARVAGEPTALVLGGGGILGSFETGALRFLYDQVGIAPSVICGASVGSLIAAKMAEGDNGETGRRAIDALVELWRGLRQNGDMWRPEPWFDALLTDSAWASELRQPTEAGHSHAHVMLHVIGTVLRHGHDALATVEVLRQALGARSLLNLEPVRALLAEQLDAKRVAASDTTLRVATVGLESGDLRYVTETGSFVDRDNGPLDLEPVPLAEAVLASCSIPLVFPPVPLGTEHYVDGGTREMLPLQMATTCLGRGHTFAVAALPLGLPHVGSFEGKGMVDVWRRVTGSIGNDEMLHKTVDPPGGWGSDVTLVIPQLRVHDPLTIDPELIGISIDYGFMRAADVVLGASDDEGRITTEITRTRMRYRDAKGTPVPGPFGAAKRPEPVDEPPLDPDHLQDRLATLVARRRDSGLPVAPSL